MVNYEHWLLGREESRKKPFTVACQITAEAITGFILGSSQRPAGLNGNLLLEEWSGSLKLKEAFLGLVLAETTVVKVSSGQRRRTTSTSCSREIFFEAICFVWMLLVRMELLFFLLEVIVVDLHQKSYTYKKAKSSSVRRRHRASIFSLIYTGEFFLVGKVGMWIWLKEHTSLLSFRFWYCQSLALRRSSSDLFSYFVVCRSRDNYCWW